MTTEARGRHRAAFDGPLYIGFDSSTQSLSAVVLEAPAHGDNRHRVVLETSLPFDEALPHYGTRHGVLPSTDPHVAVSSPLMWAEALDAMIGQLASRLDLRRLAAVSGSAQQHGSVYLNASASGTLGALDHALPLPAQIAPLLSRPVAPIWMDSSTSLECREIAAAVGGQATLARHTGSRACERFTGPQIRRFFAHDPAGYAMTDRIHVVSSYLASLLVGGHAPIDPGDGSGMNLMDLAANGWWAPALDATAPGLKARLPSIAPASTIAGRLSPYWQARHGLPPAKVAVWSGDNPSSLVGVGLVREGRAAISLGTSDTIFGLMREPRVSADGTGHVFGAPTGDFMGLTCFRNGSLARERLRDAYGLTWEGFSHALETTPPGNGGRLRLPWFEPEITPPFATSHVRVQDLDERDGSANIRALIEAQMMAMALHSRWMGVSIDAIHATGGAAANPQILQVMADVFGAEVRRFDVSNSAALGAALRALHADRLDQRRAMTWDEIVGGLEQSSPAALRPTPADHATYRELLPLYAELESRARSMGSRA